MGNSVPNARKFSNDEIPDQTGKIVVVTGGNIGLGFGISKALAIKGAKVYIASRNLEKVNKAVEELKQLSGNPLIFGEVVDLGSFASIDVFVASITSKEHHIDLLVDNGGLFIPPFGKTIEGFETTLGVNAIGTIYLTNQLLPLLLQSSAARLVMISAYAINQVPEKLYHRVVVGNDLGGEKLVASDLGIEVYGLSKMLQTMYATELHRRLAEKGIKNLFVASAHPGCVRSDSLTKSDRNVLLVRLIEFVFDYIAVSPEVGALSPLFLATAPLNEVEPYKGAVLHEGPTIKLLPIAAKDYTPENCMKVYDAMRALIEQKGYQWIEI